jgi:hypothetical protein
MKETYRTDLAELESKLFAAGTSRPEALEATAADGRGKAP